MGFEALFGSTSRQTDDIARRGDPESAAPPPVRARGASVVELDHERRVATQRLERVGPPLDEQHGALRPPLAQTQARDLLGAAVWLRPASGRGRRAARRLGRHVLVDEGERGGGDAARSMPSA